MQLSLTYSRLGPGPGKYVSSCPLRQGGSWDRLGVGRISLAPLCTQSALAGIQVTISWTPSSFLVAAAVSGLAMVQARGRAEQDRAELRVVVRYPETLWLGRNWISNLNSMTGSKKIFECPPFSPRDPRATAFMPPIPSFF